MLVLIKSVVKDSQPLGLDVVKDITGVGLTVTVTATVGVSVTGQLGSDNVTVYSVVVIPVTVVFAVFGELKPDDGFHW